MSKPLSMNSKSEIIDNSIFLNSEKKSEFVDQLFSNTSKILKKKEIKKIFIEKKSLSSKSEKEQNTLSFIQKKIKKQRRIVSHKKKNNSLKAQKRKNLKKRSLDDIKFNYKQNDKEFNFDYFSENNSAKSICLSKEPIDFKQTEARKKYSYFEVNQNLKIDSQQLESISVYYDHISYPKAIPLNMKYYKRDLKELFYFISNEIFLKEQMTLKSFLKLNSKNKTLFLILFKTRICKSGIDPSINTLCTQLEVFRKKKEEKIKFVYKKIIRELEKQFLKEFFSNETIEKYQKLEKIFKCNKKSFVFWLFQDLIEQNIEIFDFILDVWFEITTKKNSISKSNNWTKKKLLKMKKISPTLRYLILKSKRCKSMFFHFLDKEKNVHFIDILGNQTQDKLNKNKQILEQKLIDYDFNFLKFKNYFNDLFLNQRIHLPWRMPIIQNAIEFCYDELQNDSLILEEKYNESFSKHYISKTL